MSAATRVLIVGGGIGGLALGAALGQSNIAADIVEVAGPSRVHGVGIIQPGNALRALRTIGALKPCLDAGFAYEEWRVHDYAGACLGELPSALGGDGCPSWNGISRAALHDILTARAQQAGATIRLSTTVQALSPDPTGVDVVFSDDSSARYDLVVGFDGIRSATRQRILGPIAPVYTGYAVWRFTTERPKALRYGAVYYRGATKVGLVPIGDDLMYLFLVTAEPGNPRQDPSSYQQRLTEHLTGYAGLVGEVRERLTRPEDVVYSPIEQIILPGAWHRGRVLLCGDAAHASAPHLAQGAAMAIEDSVVLAELLSAGDPVDSVLNSFMSRRSQRCRAVQEVSQRLLIAEMDPEAAASLPPLEADMNIEEYLRQAV